MADEDCGTAPDYVLEDCCTVPLAPAEGDVVPPGTPTPPSSCPLFCGPGSPEGVVTSPIGGIYEQTDTPNTSHVIWFKHEGTGNTGWRQWAGLRGGSGANTALRIGDNSIASGINSVAVGENAEATGVSAVALGKNTLASGARSEAFGQDSEATADDAKAFGAGAQATAARAVAIGQGAIASGIEGIAIGDVALAAGAQGISIGNAASASNTRSIAIGDTAICADIDGIAIGNTATTNEGEINIGKNNVAAANALSQLGIFIGQNNDASGGVSRRVNIMMGLDNILSDNFTGHVIVIGDNQFVEGNDLVCLGSTLSVSGGLIGGTTVTEATYGVAIGTEATAQADCFLALGYQATAYGTGASAVGPHSRAGNNADSLHTTSLGRFATALADRSLALGSSTSVGSSHSASIALGHLATTSAAAQLMIGAASVGNRINAVHFNGSAITAITVNNSGVATYYGNFLGVITNSTATTINVTTDETTIFSDATLGNVIVNLFSAVNQAGRILIIQKTDASANTVTVDPSGAQTINGAATKVLTTQYETIKIQSDNSNWRII